MAAITPQLPSLPPTCWPSLHAFVSEGWQDLTTLPLDGTCCNDFIEIVKRIALFIPLVFATLVDVLYQWIYKDEHERALLESALKGDVAEVKRLFLDTSVDIEATDKMLMGLHAFSRGENEDIPMLVAYRGLTALHFACFKGHTMVVRELLAQAKRLNREIVNNEDNPLKLTPLEGITDWYQARRAECLRLLLNHGARFDEAEISTSLENIIKSCRYSTENGCVEAIAILIEHIKLRQQNAIKAVLVGPLVSNLASIVIEYHVCGEYEMNRPIGVLNKPPLFEFLLHRIFFIGGEANFTFAEQFVGLLLDAGASPLAIHDTGEAEAPPVQRLETVIQYMQREYGANSFMQRIIARLQEAAVNFQPPPAIQPQTPPIVQT